MCVLLITRLLRGMGRWARKPVNHTSWVTVVTPTDRPKSVHNCCLIELFCGIVCVVTLPLWHFCWYRGFCHRTGSDLLLFVLTFYFGHIQNDIRKTPRTFCVKVSLANVSKERSPTGLVNFANFCVLCQVGRFYSVLFLNFFVILSTISVISPP